AFDLAAVAIDAIALAEVALRKVLAPHVAEPGIDFLEIHGAAFLPRVGSMDDANARRLDRQAREIARHIDGIVERVARPLGLLGVSEPFVSAIDSNGDAKEETAEDPQEVLTHATLQSIRQY